MFKTITACFASAAAITIVSSYSTIIIPAAVTTTTPLAAMATQKKQCISAAWNQPDNGYSYDAGDAGCGQFANFRNPAEFNDQTLTANVGQPIKAY